jgi:drug/metabolite transporter (DMT)-like permease
LLLGILLILASTAAYNSSAIPLAVAAREHSGTSPLLLGVSRRLSGLFAISLSILGWVLEIAALTLIPLTLARILNVAGLAILLCLTRWILKEPLGGREILGVILVVLGVTAASVAPPHLDSAPPSLEQWVLLLLVLGSGSLLPYLVRALRRPVGAALWATAAGLAYALSGVLNKGIADAVYSGSILPLVLLTVGVAMVGLLGFSTELSGFREGYVSVVVPIVLALHTVVPIICAPLLFGESWPEGLLLRALLGVGIFFALLGTLVLSSSSNHVLAKR